MLAVVYLLLAILAPEAFANHNGSPLVPCGISNMLGPANQCTPCDIFVLIQNLLNFLWWHITIWVAILALIYGGLLMMFSFLSGGSSSLATKGKLVITNTIIGIFIVFVAWLGVDFIIKALGGKMAAGSADAKFGPWNKLNCSLFLGDTGGTPSGGTTNPGGPPVPGAPIANSLRTNSNIAISTNASCRDINGNSVSARTTINEVAAGQQVTVCQSGCTGQSTCRPTGVSPNLNMLASLDSLGRSNQFTITSITTGSHSSASCHYSGNCVDLVPSSPTAQNYENLRSQLQNLGGEAWCETASGQLLSSCFSATTQDPINHIHSRFP